eukprot:GDKK01051981.1.p1 GENE.GDKK01051981.1~~GDKK01051981.1.p1  ORF type:complete len:138 (-),score=10.62 GDKK01051981.1:17-406(-)
MGHRMRYKTFLCEHANGSATYCKWERGQGDLQRLRCPTCNNSKHIFQPLLASGGGRWGVITNLMVVFLYAEVSSRSSVATKLKLDPNAVGDSFKRYEGILATAAWYLLHTAEDSPGAREEANRVYVQWG